MNLQSEYYQGWDNSKKYKSEYLQTLVEQRGFAISTDLEDPGNKDKLITGINPSFDENHPDNGKDYGFLSAIDDQSYTKNDQSKHQYWIRAKQIFIGNRQSFRNEYAFVDLFPIRCSEQSEFNSLVKSNIDICFELLSVTMKAIEALKPKLIIHANKTTGYYWGINEKHKWAGYNLSPLTDITTVVFPKRQEVMDCISKHKCITDKDVWVFNHGKLIGTLLVIYKQLGYRTISNQEVFDARALFEELSDIL